VFLVRYELNSHVEEETWNKQAARRTRGLATQNVIFFIATFERSSDPSLRLAATPCAGLRDGVA
jgi:hypothetical protein